MDKISIVVAVYNAESTLNKCIESLLAQKYEQTEIILVDDCSTDNSLSVCEKYSLEYENIITVKNEQNSGVSATRNHGIDVSTGSYICFVDSDDYVEEDYLEKLYSCYSKYNTVPICGFIYHDEYNHQKPLAYRWSGGNELVSLGDSFKLMRELYLTAIWNKLFKSEIIKENNIRFDVDVSMGEDLRFSVDYFESADIDKVYAFSDTLYHYTKLNNSTLMSAYAKNGTANGIENLNRIKNLAIKYNKDAENEYNSEVENLINNLIYFLVRDKDFNNKEKLDKIREFKPDFSKKDLRAEKIKSYKEKIALLVRRFS
ncbi:MAG: glycosyltransferase family 2 protein [Acutalibacteraceae bacterium]